MKERVSLREEKFAMTRLALLDAMLKHVQRTPFAAIKVRDLCRDVKISEATFFNYFPRKTDLLYYFIQLWSIELNYRVARAPAKTEFEKIVFIFDETANRAKRNPRILSEIIAFQSVTYEKPEIPRISIAERLQAYPDFEEIENISDRGLDSLIPPLLDEAVRKRELPSSADLQLLFVGISSIFFGLPVIFPPHSSTESMQSYYSRLLRLLWKGAGGKLPKASSKQGIQD